MGRKHTHTHTGVKDERVDAGRDGLSCLATPNSQAHERGQGDIHFPCSADHEQDDWQPEPVDPNSAERAGHCYAGWANF